MRAFQLSKASCGPCRGRDTRRESLENTEALNRFLAGIERRAFRMARFATADDDEALDLVQDAMLGFVRRYACKCEEEWSPLFYRTLQSRIIDWHRRTVVRNRLRGWFGGAGGDSDEGADPLENVADVNAPDPGRHLTNRELGGAIERALRKLPLRQRQAFLLRSWEGLDVAQTALAMGCSDGSVKTHYSRAVHTLRHLLKEYRS
nr:RNA polymerase sigma factor [Geobacter sp.]